ncbi:hypothetical protein Vretifemale_19517 [Volvox reticuliferus]|uniref:Cell division cycle protein 123 n=1 Tax=Volvox reticuliferus TaxID=1737510 RepID=A0A8J4CZD5_9CHLO|nr:hypothetical protein Vretifemale_19517 [Volvox reticuliferus]
MPSIANHNSSGTHHPLIASQLPSWYPQHSGHALRSIIIPLPIQFLEYLQEDGLLLPDDTAAIPQLAQLDAGLLTEGDYRRDDWYRPGTSFDDAAAAALAAIPQPSPSGPLHSGVLSGSPRASDLQEPPVGEALHNRDDDGDDDSASSGAAGGGTDWTVRFPQLRAAVDSAIAHLGGRVVPKLNWSCPSDALWVSSSGSLACRNADQVVLLLKSSDRVVHDVTLLAAAAEAATNASAAAAAEAAAAATSAGPSGSGVSDVKSGELEAAAPSTPEETASGCSGGGGCAARRDVLPTRGTSAPEPSDQCSAGQPHEEASALTHDAVSIPQQQLNGQQHQQHRLTDLDDATGSGGAGSVSVGVSTAAAGAKEPKEEEGTGLTSCYRRSGLPSGSLTLKPVLVLKKWYDMRREREFRCFVRGGELVAVSQRDVSQMFAALTMEVLAEIRQRLWRFWKEKMQGSLPLTDFTFDVYVPTDVSTTVRLVDVNPLTDTTSPLLYDWAELGFGPDAVPPADVLLQQLLQADIYNGRREERGGGRIGVAATDRMQLADAAVASERGSQVDDPWMGEAVGGVALPLPRRAEELQVRITRVAAGSDELRSGDGGTGLAGLVGPMLLGSRAALAMPYDMLGIADTVDKMIEVMQRHQHQRVTWNSQGEGASSEGRGVGEEGVAQSLEADVASLAGMVVWPSHPLPSTRVPVGGYEAEVLPGGDDGDGEGDGASLAMELQEPSVYDNAADFPVADFIIPGFNPESTKNA